MTRTRLAKVRTRIDTVRHSGDSGFSLLEVIVSFSLFVVVAAAATVGIVSALNASHSSQQRVDAANLGQQDLALDLAAYRAGIVPQSTSYTGSVTNEQFTITRTVTYSPGATACAPGKSFTVHVGVKVAVAVGQMPGKFLAQTDTVIAC